MQSMLRIKIIVPIKLLLFSFLNELSQVQKYLEVRIHYPTLFKICHHFHKESLK